LVSAKGPLRTQPKSAASSLEDVWLRASERLRAWLGENVFVSWFASVRLEEFAGGRARLSVSTRFLKSWIESHYQEKLCAALAAELEGLSAVEVFARSLQPSSPSLSGEPADAQSAAVDAESRDAAFESRQSLLHRRAEGSKASFGSPLDRRLTFAT